MAKIKLVNRSAYTLKIFSDSWRRLKIESSVSSFIHDMESLVTFINQRPIQDFAGLNLSQIKLKLPPKQIKPEMAIFLAMISTMELQTFNDPQGFSFISYLNPTKMIDLTLYRASCEQVSELSKFVNLEKLYLPISTIDVS